MYYEETDVQNRVVDPASVCREGERERERERERGDGAARQSGGWGLHILLAPEQSKGREID